MDRAGEVASSLSGDEVKTIFEVIARGEGREKARQGLRRDRTTVLRAFNVVSEFERRSMTTCSNVDATDIAEGARYRTTPGYVQALFLQWKAWKGLESSHSKEPRQARPGPELASHSRELFYFVRRLRDRLSLPLPVDVVKDLPTLPPLWQGESASEFRTPQSDKEASVSKEWGYGPVDATKLPSFATFEKHLGENACWGELDALQKAYPGYCEACQGAYQWLMEQYAGCSVAKEDEEARVIATAMLGEVWYRVERGLSLISPQVFAAKDDITDLPWEVRMGEWFIRRCSEGEAKEVESAFLKLTSTATAEGKLQEALRLYQLLAEKRKAFRRFLLPDASLRKLILSSRCDWCP